MNGQGDEVMEQARGLNEDRFPIGAEVEITLERFGIPKGTRGTVVGHHGRSVEWDEQDGTKWVTSPAYLRRIGEGS